MTDTKTYLTRMVIFLVVVCIGLVFISDTLIEIFMVNPLLNGLIFGVILLGIILNFRQVALLGPEARWIEEFRGGESTREKALGEMPALSTDGTLRLLSPMARMLEEKRGRSGGAARFTLSAPVMRTLLDGIGARLEESRDLARYLTGLCIFIGLLGTFWGLLGTVGSISDVIGSLTVTGDDIAVMFNSLKQGLEAPLSSMSTAFSSSLFGLGGSLVLGFFDLQAGQAQNSFYNELEEWLSGLTRLSGSAISDGETGVSAYTEALLEQTAESLQELQNIMARGEQTRSSGNDHLAELNDKLSLFADQMKTQQQVLLRVAETQRDLGPLLRSMGDVANALSAPAPTDTGMDDATRHHIRNIDAGLQRLASALESGRTESLRELRNEIKLLAKTVAAVRDGANESES
jgi:biopolymer transport protein ExbB/TolQ